ncbi:DUF1842 domain-containing protein [Shewanella sedimentimangrovi]|uniref:DUF1842 domain-containing protein n=1 Tax=Shewanella sedimentimangrovi TaxID=2814293 RepID=A0ABX7QYD7_9GAMM|nr:DUF1842 domain-containing protein [Shewanella sedimentimangrovi]QSX36526.1 DUF1842 domain-containing protein [Shewanella sedimentimangrovi]
MTEQTKVAHNAKAGLFLLNLQSESGLMGAPILHLQLGIDAPHAKATGMAQVTQALANPVVCTSHVSGDVIYETVMGPGSKIRIDLCGYPIVNWPKEGGIGPVIPKNFSAIVLLDQNWEKGEVHYQYQSNTGGWVKEIQKIHEVENSLRLVSEAS